MPEENGPGGGNARSKLAICAVGVKRSFQMGEVTVPVLKGVDFEVKQGELTVILGYSGSGKTTLLNAIGGLDRPDSGEVWHGEIELTRLSDRELTRFRREHLGFVFQFYNLVPTLNARENIEVASETSADPMDALEALRLVGLEGKQDNFPSQLSGGEQQRVSIARAIARRPRLLLCDELTGALDSDTGRKVLELIVELNEKHGMTIVIITHATPIADLAHRVVRLDSGMITQCLDSTSRRNVSEIDW
jgi:putative ABC transport system ATP-binding protein